MWLLMLHFTEVKYILCRHRVVCVPFLPAVLASLVLSDTSLCLGTTVDFSMLQKAIRSPPKYSFDQNFMFFAF